MQRYFFDCRENGELFIDSEGIEVDGPVAAMIEATKGLADLAKDLLQAESRCDLAIEVRDERGRPVGLSMLSFSIHLEKSPSEE